MNLLERKLVRDIAALRGQVITIALVVAAGLAVFVASVSTFSSLQSASAVIAAIGSTPLRPHAMDRVVVWLDRRGQ